MIIIERIPGCVVVESVAEVRKLHQRLGEILAEVDAERGASTEAAR